MTPPQNVPDWRYRLAVQNRQARCLETIFLTTAKAMPRCALIVLSCKRPEAAKNLLASLWPLRRLAKLMPWVWADNGSGDAVVTAVRQSGMFHQIISHPVNLGMGAAINDALTKIEAGTILFIEDDLQYVGRSDGNWVWSCLRIFDEFPEIGIIKLKHKDNWDTMYPYRRIGPMQTTTSGVQFHPWLPSPRWTFRWGQRPWFPVGIHNGWSLGPVMFRRCVWLKAGPIPSGQGRGQAIAAEEEYAKRVNVRWLAARPVDESMQVFSQPVTAESPGFLDNV